MFTWLVDHAGTVYLLLGIIAIAFVAAWYMTKRAKHLALAGVVVGIIALVYLLTLVVVSDRGQIRNNLHAMAAAVAAGKGDAFIHHLAKDFQFGGRDRKQVKDYALQEAKKYGVYDIYIWEIDVRELSREEGTAQVEFRLRASARDGTYLAFCRSTFELEEDHWKMKTIGFFNPVNTQQEIDIPE